MASYNRVILMGNLTRDPEYKQLSSGQGVCKLGLASNRQFKNKQTGSMIQEVCFIDVDVWGAQAESCNQYLQKGRPVLIEGRIKFDSWQDADGSKRSKHSIVADRVTFLASSQQDVEEGFSDQGDGSSFDDNSSKKSVAPARKSTSKSASSFSDSEKSFASTGEVTLKDEAPFEDDLPF